MKNYFLEHDCYNSQDKIAVRTSFVLDKQNLSQLLGIL